MSAFKNVATLSAPLNWGRLIPFAIYSLLKLRINVFTQNRFIQTAAGVLLAIGFASSALAQEEGRRATVPPLFMKVRSLVNSLIHAGLFSCVFCTINASIKGMIDSAVPVCTS
mgnify:CR=1 FL=1